MPIVANCCERLGIWFATQRLGRKRPRYWNAFGTGRPGFGKTKSIICEINFAATGINRQLEGALARDERGDFHLIHRGGIGGGRKGVGRASFSRHFGGDWVTVSDGDHEVPVALVADLRSPRAAVQVAEFVFEVRRIKKLAVDRAHTSKTQKPWLSFKKEPERRSPYKVEGWRCSSADHGLVVSALRKQIEALGMRVANDEFRDLFVVGRTGRIVTLFEVKTGDSPGDVYPAIGQLLFHSLDRGTRPILAVVSPPLRQEVIRRLGRLGLRHVAFRFKGSRVAFSGLGGVVAQQ